MQDPSRSYIDVRRELALQLVHATESAALAAARLLGRGDADRVHEAASEAMRRALEDSGLSGSIELGSRSDPILPPGTSLQGGEPRVDFGAFPVEGAGPGSGGAAHCGFMVG